MMITSMTLKTWGEIFLYIFFIYTVEINILNILATRWLIDDSFEEMFLMKFILYNPDKQKYLGRLKVLTIYVNHGKIFSSGKYFNRLQGLGC